MSSNPDNSVNRISPREHVRTRAGMYIGYTDERALEALVCHVLDHAMEDAFLGVCDDIQIILHPNTEISIIDNGRGFPTEVVTTKNKRVLELIFTEPGIKEPYREPGSSMMIEGFKGIGLFAINALCASLTVTTTSEGYRWQQSYSEGLPISELEQIAPLESSAANQTIIRFRPDFSTIQQSEFHFEVIAKLCQELTYQVAGLRFIIRDERTEPNQEVTYYYEDGVASLVRDTNSSQKTIHDPVWHRETITTAKY